VRRQLRRFAFRALGYAAVACLAIVAYAQLVPRWRVELVEPSVPLDWVEPWYSAPVVTVTEREMLYQGQLLASVETMLHDDSPTIRIEALAERLRWLRPDVDPLGPPGRRQRAHLAACASAQRRFVDRRILCAGRFIIVEMGPYTDRNAWEVLPKIVRTGEELGYHVVVTRLPSSSRN
jgi:hypothetical protein